MNQDADLYVTTLAPGQSVTHDLRPARSGWAQVAAGAIFLQGEGTAARLEAGDGAAISREKS